MLQQVQNSSSAPNEASLLRVSELRKTLHGSLLCYPGNDLSSFSERINELRELGVSSLTLEGTSKIGRFGVAGKGCVSIVVKAHLKSDSNVYALKIRRADANRPSMAKDYELQKFANSFGVGPKAVAATENFFLMEYIDSLKIGKWFQSLRTRSPKKFVRSLLRNSLYQCFLLDLNHLDHGELSNPSKHILIRKDNADLRSESVIIDYESASLERKPSNLTASAQFFFFGNYQSAKMRKILGIPKTNTKIISLLREYKENPREEAFANLMSYVGC
jgi:putative serine/threonine protein kinase